MHHNKLIRKFLIILMVSVGLLLSQGFGPADAKGKTDEEKKPERLIVMAAEYPGVVVPADENVSIDLTFFNKGRSDESVDVWVNQELFCLDETGRPLVVAGVPPDYFSSTG